MHITQVGKVVSEDERLLKYCDAQSRRTLPTFQMWLLPPSQSDQDIDTDIPSMQRENFHLGTYMRNAHLRKSSKSNHFYCFHCCYRYQCQKLIQVRFNYLYFHELSARNLPQMITTESDINVKMSSPGNGGESEEKLYLHFLLQIISPVIVLDL
jgi:hypothetical protein